MGGKGYEVQVEDLRTYSKKLEGKTGHVDEVSGLVGTADVGDESWGIVGLFVKDEYTTMLEDLKNLLTDMKEGFQSGADKFAGAADGYQTAEENVQKLLDGISGQIENAPTGA